MKNKPDLCALKQQDALTAARLFRLAIGFLRDMKNIKSISKLYFNAHPQICGRNKAGKFCGYSRVIVTVRKPAFSRNTAVGFISEHPPITIFHNGFKMD